MRMKFVRHINWIFYWFMVGVVLFIIWWFNDSRMYDEDLRNDFYKETGIE